MAESLKRSFREPVTVASTGGKDGGGMLVTEFGDALIKSYRGLERDFGGWQSGVSTPSFPRFIRHSKSGARVSVRRQLD